MILDSADTHERVAKHDPLGQWRDNGVGQLAAATWVTLKGGLANGRTGLEKSNKRDGGLSDFFM